MSKFDDWFKQADLKLSDVATYFVKPLLRDAFNAGRAQDPVKKPSKAAVLEKELVGK